jgi:alkylhydroperoxidase family enzyme
MLIGNDRLIEAATDEYSALIEALPSWPSSAQFTTAQRACLALTEEFVIDVASSTDEALAAVSAELGEQAMADFVSALLVVEQRQRLSMMWERLGL